MKKKVRLSEEGKAFLMVVAVFLVVIGGTMLYLKQIERANNGEIKITCDCMQDR